MLTKCLPLSRTVDGVEDTVYIAATENEYDGRIWWITFRLNYSAQPIDGSEANPDGIEVARLKPSCSSGMLGTTIESVCRCRLVIEGAELRAVEFDNRELLLQVTNPMSIYDYADQTPPLK